MLSHEPVASIVISVLMILASLFMLLISPVIYEHYDIVALITMSWIITM